MSIKIINLINKSADIITDSAIQYVPIRPICEYLGVNFNSQLSKIKDHDILSNHYTLKTCISKDGKKYKMSVIPLRYVFGWILTINPKNVKKTSKSELIEYQKKCYEIIFNNNQ